MPFRMNPENKAALTWTFFQKRKGSADADGMRAATACVMEPSNVALDTKSSPGYYKVDGTRFTLTVRVTNQSWVYSSAIKNSEESTRLLNHERTHYLLASCVAWDVYLQIKRVEETSAQSLQIKLNALRAQAAATLQTMSDQYDRDTNHGRDQSMQRVWDLKIEKWDREQSE